MKSYEDLMLKKNVNQLFFVIVLICYIIFNIQTPSLIAPLVDNIYGNIIVIILAFFVLVNCNPILGILFLFASYEFIRRSSDVTGTSAIQRYLPSEIKKDSHFSAFNQFPITLEEQIVSKMAPLVQTPGPSNLNYEPVSDFTHDAMNIQDSIKTF